MGEKYTIRIVAHPSRDAQLPFTYPGGMPLEVAVERLDAFNAMPGYRGELAEVAG